MLEILFMILEFSFKWSYITLGLSWLNFMVASLPHSRRFLLASAMTILQIDFPQEQDWKHLTQQPKTSTFNNVASLNYKWQDPSLTLSKRLFDTTQGVSYWRVQSKFALTDRNVQVRFCWKVVLEFWDLYIYGTTTSFYVSGDFLIFSLIFA